MLCGEALSPGVCPALRLFSVLAAFLQRPKSFPRHLQHFCKVQKVFRSTCGTSAKTIFSVLTLEEFLQAFPKVICPFGCSIFGHSAGIGTKKSRACDVESQALLSAKNRRTGGAVRGLHVIYSTISTIGAPT